MAHTPTCCTITRSHFIADHDAMRTKALSDANLAIDLLGTALAAIDGGSINTAREFIDRAHTDLDRVIRTLGVDITDTPADA